MQKILTREKFIRRTLYSILFFLIPPIFRTYLPANQEELMPRTKKNVHTSYDLVTAQGENIRINLTKALDQLGGIKNFVKRGDTVVIKPNIAWNRKPEYAANTNPDLVEELVKLCLSSGASRVRVFDHTCNNPRMCYINSGIKAAVKKAGGEIYHVSKWKFQKARFPEGSLMQGWPLFRDAINCDCFINIPIAKHHSLTGLTLSMKNLMGVCGGRRGEIHWNIDRKLVELTSFIKPDLTIIDAHRVLVRNGPSGGSLGDVKIKNTVIVSVDPVLADSTAARLMGKSPMSIGHIKEAKKSGLGKIRVSPGRSKRLIL